MLAFLSEFGVLFAVFAGLVLTVAWRKGWFSEHLADEISVKPDASKPGRTGHWEKVASWTGTEPARAPADNMASGQDLAGRRSDARVSATRNSASDDAATDDLPADMISEAKRVAQAAALATYPAFWSKEAIQQRAGWMLFEPSDFLGEPDRVFEYPIAGTDRVVELPLFAAERVRAVEQSNTLIQMSRRKVVMARWTRRSERLAQAR